MEIRTEQPSDCETIHRLTKVAFEPMPYSQGDEAECIVKLRDAGDLTLSLVAIEASHVVGHIAFSPVFFDEEFKGWYGLGPVAVWPHLQRRGIGSALITLGLAKLKEHEALGCVLIGNPAYYCRFGFVGDGRLTYRNLPSNIVQWLAFGASSPSGILKFSPGLE